jgi:membrane fusion protein (multidrug efflux system)
MKHTKIIAIFLIALPLLFSCKSKSEPGQGQAPGQTQGAIQAAGGGQGPGRGPGSSGPSRGGRDRGAASAIVVDVIAAEKEVVTNSLEVNGTVLSNEAVELRPETSGRLVYLNIPDGARVAQGTVLARVNDAELQAQLEQQKSQLDLAQKTEKRLAALLKVNGVNQSDYDVAVNQLNSIQANIKVTTALIEKTVIKAPFTGELGLRLVSQGAYVTPSTLLGTLQQKDKVKIDFAVPETYAGIIRKGDKVRVISNNAVELEASISAVEPQVNSVSRNIKVRALLANGVVLPGAFVKVILDQQKESIMVPSNSIIPDAINNQVVVIHKDKAVFTNVETGIRNASHVEITKGLNIGDSVVVSGMLSVRPNATVKVQKVKKIGEV